MSKKEPLRLDCQNSNGKYSGKDTKCVVVRVEQFALTIAIDMFMDPPTLTIKAGPVMEETVKVSYTLEELRKDLIGK
jgi:hypothetical protein